MTEGPDAGNTWLRGKMCSVCGKSSAVCYAARTTLKKGLG